MQGFTAPQLERYKRHLMLPEVGTDGQRRLLRSRVLLIGAGGLGSPAALYLTAAGVGQLGIVDFDRVEASNLQRQVLYGTADVGAPKLGAAARRLQALNPDVRITPHAQRFSPENAERLVSEYDVVLDGTDSFATRYLSSDVCVWRERPLVYGSVMRFEGYVSVFDASRGPCYRCLFPEPPPPELAPNCAEAGVLGVLPGIIGTLQAAEVLKLLLGAGEPLIGRLLAFDALAMEFRSFQIPKEPECAVCGPSASIHEPIDYDAFCATACASDRAGDVPSISAAELRQRLASEPDVLLIDVREPFEHALRSIPGARLIPGGELEQRAQELSAWRERPLVVHCQSGGRSLRACRWLLQRGFRKVENLEGGIESWLSQSEGSGEGEGSRGEEGTGYE